MRAAIGRRFAERGWKAQGLPQGAWSLTHRDAVLEQKEHEGLIDYSGALADEPAADPMQRLKIELRSSLLRGTKASMVGRCTATFCLIATAAPRD